MTDDDKRQRNLDLLRKSHRALEVEQAQGPIAHDSAPTRPADVHPASDEPTMMYRGRPVRQTTASPGRAGAASRDGAGGPGGQFRGAGNRRPAAGRPGASHDDLKALLAKLNDLHREGLISKAEFDAKRLQILDRL
jgi:hypothetical protein